MSRIIVDLATLPANWQIVRLGDICRTTSGGTPSRRNPAFYEGDIPWVKSGELPDGPVLDIEEFVSEDAIKNSSAKVFPSGSLLVAMYGATVGKLGILTREAATNQAVCAIFPPEGLHNKYLFWYLRAMRSDLVLQAIGGAQPNISQGILREISIPLAPLAQQARIVAEIEKQFSRLDEAVANLKRVKANLKRYKAAVLKAAVEGKLTEDWRKQHPDVEPADRLLERILAKRRKAAGKGKYKEPVGQNTRGLPVLPAGWVWASYAQVGYLNLGRQRSPKYHSGQHMRPYLRVQNVFEDRIELSDVMEMDFPPSDFEKYELKPGDLLLNEGQSPELLGRPAIYRGELPGVCFTNTLIRFRAVPGVSIEFALIVSRHNMRSGRFVDEGTITTNIAHLSLGRLATVEFPVPSFSEQCQIVAEVERRLSIVAGAEAQVDANLRRADRLRQSILKQAFSSQLVPQDTNDEPASVLLERIRATQPAQSKEPAAPQRKHRTPGPKTGEPASRPLPMVAESSATYGDAIATRLLAVMQPSREYARADLAELLSLTTSQWNVAIQELKRVGKVRQTGEKRGARYVIVLSK